MPFRSRVSSSSSFSIPFGPSLAVKPVVESTEGALIMSGTLSPLDLFAEVVGLDEAAKKAYPAIQDPDNIRMVVDPGVTTTYRERGEGMILRIGERLASEIKGVSNGALIFFPQRRFMHACLDASLDVHGAEMWRFSQDGHVDAAL